jgi:ABC-2 type transport system ATP-binding protein
MGVRIEALGIRASGAWLVRGLDLEVAPGRCAVLTGPPGSGKSTVLRCLYGVRTPDEGTVTVGGAPPDELDAGFRRRVSALLDDTEVFEALSPVQHLELLTGRSDPASLLAGAGLGEQATVAAAELSPAQRQRLLLLVATVRPFDVLLLDEPQRALDAEGRAWMTEAIARATGHGAAVVVASGYRPLADAADTVVELGRTTEMGDPGS